MLLPPPLLFLCRRRGSQNYQLLDEASVARAVGHSDVVINLVGQDYDSR